MGALVSDRKRHYFSSNHGMPPVYTPRVDLIDARMSKKPKLLSMSEIPSPSVSSKSVVSRISRYPVAPPPLRRAVHAPCRNFNSGFSAHSAGGGYSCFRLSGYSPDGNSRSKSSGFSEQEGRSDLTGRILLRQFHQARNRALDSLRFEKVDKEVIDVDEEAEKVEDVEVEDMSVEEVIEDLRGQSVVSHEDNGTVLNVQEWDSKSLGHNFQPSSSFAASKLTNADVKPETLENKLDLLLKYEHNLADVSVYKKLLDEMKIRRDSKLNHLNFQIALESERLSSLRLMHPAKKIEKDVSREAFIQLTEEEEAEVSRAFSANRQKVLVTHLNSSIEITGEILQCLRPGQWLNDEVINLYLELLKEREKREPKKFLKCHFFSTFFYKRLVGGRGGYDYKSVKRWTTQRKLGYSLIECDKIFVPIHKEVHWCLAVINKKDEKIQYLDSLGGTDVHVLKMLARYYVEEVKDKSGKDIDISSWGQENVVDLPEQMNGFDCGVFMVKYADFYSRDIGLCFNQEHMPYFRRRTAKEILRLKAD